MIISSHVNETVPETWLLIATYIYYLLLTELKGSDAFHWCLFLGTSQSQNLIRFQSVVENRRQTGWAAQGRNPQHSSFKMPPVLRPEMLEGSTVFLPPK